MRVAKEINSKHFHIGIDEAYDAMYSIFNKATGKAPKYEV